jgi:hypothetical protein
VVSNNIFVDKAQLKRLDKMFIKMQIINLESIKAGDEGSMFLGKVGYC